MLKIRLINLDEIPLLKDFAPPDWSSDTSEVFSFHFGQPYFYPLVSELDGKIVGCAEGLLNGKTGWLGNIIVLPAFRGRGIGYSLTAHLMEFFRSRGCTHQILIATSMGEPVYRKLGFRVISHYIFVNRDRPTVLEEVPDMRKLTTDDHGQVFALDQRITGEDRQPLLSRFLEDGWVHQAPKSREIDGFFLPGMGKGIVLAENDPAGLTLLNLKLSLGCTQVTLPEANTASFEHLLKAGFQKTRRAPRMALGEDILWQPGQVYSRAAGYCG